jgi:hypothetical protein
MGATDAVHYGRRALDDAIEASLSHYPSPLSVQVMGVKRKTGSGCAGWPIYCSPQGSLTTVSANAGWRRRCWRWSTTP